MPDNPTLLQPLASRAKCFHSKTGISQASIAKAIGLENSNYSAFLSGKRGIGAESTCLLLKFLAMPKREAVAKFSKPTSTAKVMALQEHGRAMTFDGNDGAGVPGLIGSGTDPNTAIGNTIDNTPTARDLPDADDWISQTADVLRTCRGYHREAIKAHKFPASFQQGKSGIYGTYLPTLFN